jgi:hypothetical protein
MALLLGARGFDNVLGPRPRGQNTPRADCHDEDGISECYLSRAEGTSATPDTPEAFPKTTDDSTAVALETNGLGGSGSTAVQNPVTIVSTALPTQDAASTLSTTLTSPEPSLQTVGTVEAPPHDPSGLTTGEVVGIAVGTLFIGAALAFLAAFLLFKRRNRQRHVNIGGGGGTGYPNYGDSAPELVMVQKSVGSLGDVHSPYVQIPQTPMLARRPVPPAMPAPPAPVENTTHMDLTGFLPPAAQDREVCDRISALFEKMHEHVERNYRDVHASITPSMESGIASFGAKDVNMTELLQECSSPTTALKHALVSYVLGITDSKKHDEHMGILFPEELSSTKHERHDNSSGTIFEHITRVLAAIFFTTNT